MLIFPFSSLSLPSRFQHFPRGASMTDSDSLPYSPPRRGGRGRESNPWTTVEDVRMGFPSLNTLPASELSLPGVR
jgi:hypothetical protein